VVATSPTVALPRSTRGLRATARLEPHLAGGLLSEEEAHEPWEEIHERYAERLGVDPTPGRRFIAAQRAGR
jgi:hypothetical protein